jgi:hypothetical protein
MPRYFEVLDKDANMRAIWKVTSGALLTKHTMSKNVYYIYKIHTYLSYIST